MVAQPSSTTHHEALAFAPFTLRQAPLALSCDMRPVKLQLQALKLLALLALRPGELVTLEDIRAELWPTRTVDFARSIHVHVRRIRLALGDDAQAPRFLETVPQQGYRFVAPVSRLKVAPDTHRAPRTGTQRRRHFMGLAVAAAVGVVAVLTGVVLGASDHSVLSADARDAYARGRYLLEQANPESARLSVVRFDEVIAAEPSFAPAHVGAGKALAVLGDFDGARAHAEAALALDVRDAGVHALLGRISLMHDWRWDEGRRHLERALELDPTFVDAHVGLATYYATQRQFTPALAHMQSARDLDPVSALVRGDYGWFHLYAGNYERAEVLCGEAVELAPDAFEFQYCRIRARAAVGAYASAQDLMVDVLAGAGLDAGEYAAIRAAPPERALEVFDAWRLARYEAPDRAEPVSLTTLAVLHAQLGDVDAAIDLLERAIDERRPMAPMTLLDPAFGNLRDHPRIVALRQRP